MVHDKVNVLFTSAGRRVELLRAFRKAFQSLGLHGQIVVTDIDPLAPALHVADQFYLVPRYTSSEYIPALLEICQREVITLVFPLIDPDIPLLAAQKEVFAALGTQAVVVGEPAATVTADKWRTTRFFRELGLPVPQSRLREEIDPSAASYPLFIKPRQGSAAKHAFKVNNARELAFFLDYVPDPIIQECLPGPEITNDVICDLDGEVLAVVSRQRIEVRWGEVAKGVTVYDPAIAEACIKIARALPAVGPITVQCMMKDSLPYFTEINARLGGGVPLGIAAGVDSPRWLLAKAAGIPIDIPPLGSYQVGLYLTRFDESYFLTEDQRASMASHRL